MENKIKVGEYIRTEYGIIGKILEDEDIAENGVYIDTTFLDDYADETNFVKYKDIKKHSFNIIDLIEEGDYVNGIYVEKNNGRYLGTLECCYQDSSLGHIEYIKIFPYEIHSIVTKEQFKSAEYEV